VDEAPPHLSFAVRYAMRGPLSASQSRFLRLSRLNTVVLLVTDLLLRPWGRS